MKILPGGR